MANTRDDARQYGDMINNYMRNVVPRPSYMLEAPDERPGVDFIGRLAKIFLYSTAMIAGYKVMAARPKMWAAYLKNIPRIGEGVNLSKSGLLGLMEGEIPLVNYIKQIFEKELDIRAVDQYKAVMRGTFLKYGKRARTDLESLTVGDVLNAKRVEVFEEGKKFVELYLTEHSKPFRIASEDLSYIESAVERGYLYKATALAPDVYKLNGQVLDLRMPLIGGWFRRRINWLASRTRLPLLNFSPFNLIFPDLIAEQKFFIGRELSVRGLPFKNVFLVGGDVYGESGQGIKLIKSGVKHGFTTTNLGYAHAVRAGYINEMLYGKSVLFRKYKDKMNFKEFEETVWPDIISDKDRWLREAREIWESERNLDPITRKLLDNLPEFIKNETHPMYARYGSVWTSLSDAISNVFSGEKARVVVSPKYYEQMPYTRFVESLESFVGLDTEHIRWLPKKEAEVLEKSPEKLGEILSKYSKKGVGQSPREIWGVNVFKESGKVERVVPKYYVYDPKTDSETSIALHYVAERINRLFEATTGFGIRPSSTWYGQFLRQITHVAVPAMIGWYGLNLANDVIDAITFGTISPKKMVGHTLAAGLLAKQSLLNITGMSWLADHVEDIAPGSTDSFLADIGMTVIGGAIGAKLGSRFGKSKFGALLGLTIGALFALGDPAQPVSELWDELTGKKLVPVRKNRGWMFGRQSFKGDEVRYFKPHWYRMLVDDIAVKARYGDKLNYWLYGSLPGQLLQVAMRPIGLGNPYWLEEKGPWAYSYPLSNPIFQDVPFIGPILEWGLGSIVKPYRYYVPKGIGWAAPYKYPDSGLTPSEMRMIGVEPAIEHKSIPMHPYSFINQIGNFIHNMEQYTGLIGWGVGATLGQFNKGEYLESFHNLYGISHRYYTYMYGGILGLSEYPRRFMPRELGKMGWYNPLPAPYIKTRDFPGTLAKAEKDRQYPIDFYYGGPTKIPFGEIRLPGPGVEAALGIESGPEGDTLDKYLMLSYLAPGSQAQKDARKVVKSWIKAGVVDYGTARKLGWTQWAISERLARMHFDPLDMSSFMTSKDQFYLDYIQRLFSPPTIGKGRIKDPHALDIIEAYNTAATRERWPSFTIPGADWLAGFIWENITHVDLPIPFVGTLLTRKMIHNRSALEEYEYTRLYANNFASWDTPLQTLIADTFFNWGDLLGFDVKPPRVGKESDIILYTDALKYAKYRQLEQQALMYNQPQIASKLRQAMKETITGADITSPFSLMRSAYRSVPGPDKPFLKSFMFAPYSDREVIYNEVAPHLKVLLEKAWRVGWYKDYNKIVKMADWEASQRIMEGMQKYGPPPDMFWHPGFDMKRERLRLARREALDIHRFGLWEQQEWRYDNGIVPAWR